MLPVKGTMVSGFRHILFTVARVALRAITILVGGWAFQFMKL